MTENPNPNNTDGTNSSAETENTGHMIPKTRFDQVNNENKSLKERLKALEDKQNADETARQTQRQKELAEQSRFEELYKEALKEIDSLKSVQDEAKRYREGFQSTLQTRLDSIPEDKRHLIPELDPIKLSAWLDKALPDLVTPAKPKAPGLDGGSGGVGTGGQSAALSAGQQSLADLARGMGYAVKDENIAKYAKTPQKPSDTSGDK